MSLIKFIINLIKDTLRTSITSIILTLPMAVLIGIIYKFPLPFVGYVSGFEILNIFSKDTIFSLIIYNLILSPIMIIAGIISSVIINILINKNILDETKKRKYLYISGIIVAFAIMFFFAILDKIIAPY